MLGESSWATSTIDVSCWRLAERRQRQLPRTRPERYENPLGGKCAETVALDFNDTTLQFSTE